MFWDQVNKIHSLKKSLYIENYFSEYHLSKHFISIQIQLGYYKKGIGIKLFNSFLIRLKKINSMNNLI